MGSVVCDENYVFGGNFPPIAMRSSFCFYFWGNVIQPTYSRRGRQYFWRKNDFSSRSLFNDSEPFWAVYFKSWILELFQRTFIKVKSLFFTYSTLFFELVLYWLYLDFWFIIIWQFVGRFCSITYRIIFDNYKTDQEIIKNGILHSVE